MKSFWKFYRWAMDFKLFAGVYTAGMLAIHCALALLRGVQTISIWTLFQMLCICAAFSAVQTVCLRAGAVLSRAAIIRRTAVWAVCGNVLLLGGTLYYGWFADPMPVWGILVTFAGINLALFFTWLGVRVAFRADTAALNDSLRRFQAQT